MVVIALVAAIGPVLIVLGGLISLLGLLISPIGLVVLAVIALIAIGVALWKNWEKISDFAKSIWDGIKNYFVKNFNETKDFFMNIWNSLFNFYSGILNRMWTVVKEYFNIIKGIFTGDMQLVLESLSHLWRAIFGDKIADVLDKFLFKVMDIWDAVIAFMKTLPAKALQWGKDIIQGLIDGVKNMAGNLLGALKSVVTGAVDSVKKFLGIKSPSKVFENIGFNVGAGMEKGIKGMQAKVNTAMNVMASPQLSIAGAGGGAGSQTIIIELDGRQIAKSVGPHFMNEVRVKQGLKI
jgi:phage-related protein